MKFIEVQTVSPVVIIFKKKEDNIILGQGIQHIDGYFYFAPDVNSPKSLTAWSSEVLREISDKLNEMNQEWEAKVNSL